jgi:transcriptional regulator of acetoin/glycerol metabolism
VLERHQWNRVAAAAALGMSRSTLWRRMRELGLVKRVATFR